MKRVSSLVIGLSIMIGTGTLLAQDYFPLTPGNKWRYEWARSEIILEVEAAPHVYNGNTYWAVIDSTPEVAYDSSTIVFEDKPYQIYTMAREGMPIATMFCRKDTKSNVYWYDDESDTESLIIPNELKEGKTWMSADKRLQFKIISTNGIFESKSSLFKDCLVISTKVLRPRYPGKFPVSFDYYCEGIGHVGSKTENESRMMLLKWVIRKSP